MDPREPTESDLQKLEEKVQKAQEAFEKEEKLRKEVEALNAKLLQEKTDLLASLEGEKGTLSDVQERANKLQAQKTDLESQLHVSIIRILAYTGSHLHNINVSYKLHPATNKVVSI